MGELLLSGKAITVYELVIIAVLVVILIRQSKKSREIKRRKQISNVKMRNLQLDEMLKNPSVKTKQKKQPNPYDVQYLEADGHPGSGLAPMQVEILLHTGTSVKKYLFDLNREIRIGRASDNDLPISDGRVSRKNCSIFERGGTVYVKCREGAAPVSIRRGKNSQTIQNQMAELQSKDVLVIGQTELQIFLYEN